MLFLPCQVAVLRDGASISAGEKANHIMANGAERRHASHEYSAIQHLS